MIGQIDFINKIGIPVTSENGQTDFTSLLGNFVTSGDGQTGLINFIGNFVTLFDNIEFSDFCAGPTVSQVTKISR